MMRRWFIAAAVGLLATVAPPPTYAQELDTSFAGDGRLRADFGTRQDGGDDVAIQRDGRILVASKSGLMRYTPSGSLDPTFSGDGRVRSPASEGSLFQPDLALQADGRIVATDGTGVARYLADGSPDPTFSEDGRVELFGSSDVAIQGDGKIIVSRFSSGEWRLTRLRSDGSSDASFGDKVVAAFGGIDDLAVQADGKILLAYTAASMGSTAFFVLRLTADGSYDRGFGHEGGVSPKFTGGESAEVHDVAIQGDGKIVAVGSDQDVFSSFDQSFFAVARFHSDGSRDRSFSRDGERFVRFGGDAFATGVALQSDGGIVLAGFTNPLDRPRADFALARLRPDGSLSGKGVTSLGQDDGAAAVAIQPDGRIVAAGSAGRPTEFHFPGDDDLALARYRRLSIDRPRIRVTVRRRQRLARVLKRGLVFRLRSAGLVKGSARLVDGGQTLGRRRARLCRRGSTRFGVHLSRRAKLRLRRRGGGRATLRVKATNAEGTSRTVTRRVLLR